MKTLLLLFLLPLGACAYAQPVDSTAKASDTVSFVTVLDKAHASKDGIYLNGYVVEMGYDEILRYHGKKIRVTGKVVTVKGLKNRPKHFDKDGKELHEQGRENDMQHILSPQIEILSE